MMKPKTILSQIKRIVGLLPLEIGRRILLIKN